MRIITLLIMLLFTLKSYSQCVIEEIIVNIKDTIHLKTEMEIIDIYAFDPKNEYNTFNNLEKKLDSLNIPFSESPDNKFKMSFISKHYEIKKPTSKVKSEIDKLTKYFPSIKCEYQLKHNESNYDIYKKEMDKVETQAYSIANLMIADQNCSIESIKSIELISNEINDKENLKDNLDIIPGWNTQINFKTKKQLFKHFEYRYTFKLKSNQQ